MLMTMKDILISFAANMNMHKPDSTPKSLLSHAKQIVHKLMISADNEQEMNNRNFDSDIICSSDSETESLELVNRRKAYEKVIEEYLGSVPNSFHKSIEKAFMDPENDETNPLRKLARIYCQLEQIYKSKAQMTTNINKIQEYQEELTS